MAVYVDTSAWIALHEARDRNHKAAKQTLDHLLGAREPLVTGWHTLVELADGLQRHYSQQVAARELDLLLGSRHLRVEPSDPYAEAAMHLLRGGADWNVDLSDCLSFALMEALAIRRAFTFDGDFAKAGFESV